MRIYTVEFENVSITNAAGDQDLFYIAPADDIPVAIHALYLDQISDVGDAQEEVLRYRIIRGHTTVGSGGAAATARSIGPGDSGASFTARTNDTTIASAGTAVNIHSGGFNVRVGLPLVFPVEHRPVVSQAQGSIVVRLMAGPADDLTMSGTLYLEELV
jgi:hypothetical protein